MLPPLILIDTREQTPWSFERVECSRVALPVGDYTIDGSRVIIERKSPADLASTVLRDSERFKREIERVPDGSRLYVITEGTLESAANSFGLRGKPSGLHRINGAIASLLAQYPQLNIVVCESREAAQDLAERLLMKAHKYAGQSIQ